MNLKIGKKRDPAREKVLRKGAKKVLPEKCGEKEKT